MPHPQNMNQNILSLYLELSLPYHYTIHSRLRLYNQTNVIVLYWQSFGRAGYEDMGINGNV